ncbi:beta-1,6-N-acetylglucosaminyltransferase [Cobetia sp. MMG027]|uniref:beta-1,6-N-acetylglucosaminyltransferase n=1 Tax=Cobetia sp. MMG027 TaxID=3021980 RepID=UPI0022FE5B82|nr:beta-1,6-N-acetylglucosaminyltransferase [Cobetia sp. MMG027]MDA5564146.1 beta-1,6-N-acetylglucosaminyltransferase [Cobetia sp. MMG027]
MSEDAEVTISYLILCHDSPDRIVRLVTRILSDDETGQVIIHFDKNSSCAKFNELKARLHSNSRVHILENRVRCGWGQWSLIDASMRLLKFSDFLGAFTHCYLLSEFCFPTQNLNFLKEFLSIDPSIDYIECQDSSWIKNGIREDRIIYRHFLNKKEFPKLHRWSYLIQKNLGLKKHIPSDVEVKFGSQWWCITRQTTKYILSNYTKYKHIFKYSWIPDESFFQTLICDLQNTNRNVVNRTLTKYEFDVNGKPVNIHFPHIYVSDYFFCRKYSNDYYKD